MTPHSQPSQHPRDPEKWGKDRDGARITSSPQAQHPPSPCLWSPSHAPVMSCPLTIQEMWGRGLPTAAHTSSSLSPRLRVTSPGRRLKVGRVWMERESRRTALPAEFTAVQE